jgi:hypothetical protein
MAERDGSGLYTRDLAVALARAGHHPVVFTPRPGALSAELVQEGVPVVADLGELGTVPDVIHGNHTIETVRAVNAFPGVPAVFVAHGVGWQTEPPQLAAVRRWVAVGTVTSRLLETAGLPPERCAVVLNGVDVERFRPRARALPSTPRRALVYSNNARPGAWADEVQRACAERGISLDVVGRAAGRSVDRPQDLLADVDLVFARGRCAREALAVGCGVVLCDSEGSGPFVDRSVLDRQHEGALGGIALEGPHDAAVIGRQIDRYDRREAERASRRLRRESSTAVMAERLCEQYRAAIADGAPRDAEADQRWTVAYLGTLSGLGLERDAAVTESHQRLMATLQLERDLARARSDLALLRSTRLVRTRDRLLAGRITGPAMRGLASARVRRGGVRPA